MTPIKWTGLFASSLAAACGGGAPAHSGKVRQTAALQVDGLQRGGKGSARLTATGMYTDGDADAVHTFAVDRFDAVTLTLVDSTQHVQPIAATWKADRGGGELAQIELPQVPDGAYQLRAAYTTAYGSGEVDVALPLFAPARVHVITDRPLYEPGNTVKFRAVVLRARDLVPLDDRPGHWIVTDPTGEVMLDERAPAAAWGVVAGSFPLDHGATHGPWHVAWESAGATESMPFTVEPFVLPRFEVDASPARAYYRPGDAPIIRGGVVYSSGAPVANADVAITWTSAGDWQPPNEWQDKLLPKHVKTGPNGQFELALPKVPADLQGQANLTASLAAIDPAGDRAEGTARVLLSADGIVASLVTELGSGLVDGFNNRVYVRVTTPDGVPVHAESIKLRRAWEPDDHGLDAPLDVDGVASVQLDPGAPVNIVIPPLPYRPQPRPVEVSRGDARELLTDADASLADQVELDHWLPALAPCGKWYAIASSAQLAMRVSSAGTIDSVAAPDNAMAACLADIVRTRRLPAGTSRIYTVEFSLNDPALPSISQTVASATDAPDGLDAALHDVAQGARDCLPHATEGTLPDALAWRVHAGKKDIELAGWIVDPRGGTAAAATACVASRFAGARLRLPDNAPEDALGVVRFSISPDTFEQQARPQATTMLGYELAVSTTIDAKPVSTKVRVEPGALPDLRLRVSSVLANPGDTITAELLRGPNFTGQIPKQVFVTTSHGTTPAKVLEVDTKHVATIKLDDHADGWIEVRAGDGVRALIYVEPRSTLAVTVAPDHDRYAPGDRAQLHVTTAVDGHGGAAAVGLFGVDASLGQLVQLPGTDDLGRLRPQVQTSAPAFGTLDGAALVAGRIRGANAAAATVLRVTSIPGAPQLEAPISAHGETRFDPVEELTDHFYPVLAELHVQVEAWEASAPKTELMRPATMARLWSAALDACAARGLSVDDAYGRRLRLHRLPPDLLALTDPHAVVTVGTRLPEDVENWAAWVAKEKP